MSKLLGVIVTPAAGGGNQLRHHGCVEVGDCIYAVHPPADLELPGVAEEYRRTCTRCDGLVDVE